MVMDLRKAFLLTLETSKCRLRIFEEMSAISGTPGGGVGGS